MPTGASEAVQHQWVRSITAKIRYVVQNLQVEIRGDDVVLTGQAVTYYAKQLAQEAVLQSLRTGRLENRIDVVTTLTSRCERATGGRRNPTLRVPCPRLRGHPAMNCKI